MVEHGIEQLVVRPFLCGVHVFPVSAYLVCVCEHFVHSSELGAKHVLHLGRGEVLDDVQRPVAHLQEHFLSFLAAGINPRVAKTSEQFVDVVPRHPGAAYHVKVALLDLCPETLAVGDTSYVAVAVGILRTFEFREHILETIVAFLVACSGVMYCQGGYVVASDVAVKAFPVREVRSLGFKARFLEERGKEPVHVIFQQDLGVKVQGVPERSVQEFYVRKAESVLI